jgi:ABC-type transport system involved in multi-copper enzyme maturation permease subunit
MIDLLSAESLKLRTTRTIWLLLAGMLALTTLAVIGAITLAGNANLDLETERGVRTVLHVSASGAVFVLVLGVIISAGEYRQGTATETFLTTPRRWRVIATKLVTAAGAGIVFGALAAGTALAVANHVYALKGDAFPLGSSEAWSILGGAVLYAALFGAIGAATGSLVRNQVGVIVGWLVWLLLAENIVAGLAPGIGRWLPGAAGRGLVLDPNGDFLSQPAAAVVLAVYAVTIAAAAIGVERWRDA